MLVAAVIAAMAGCSGREATQGAPPMTLESESPTHAVAPSPFSASSPTPSIRQDPGSGPTASQEPTDSPAPTFAPDSTLGPIGTTAAATPGPTPGPAAAFPDAPERDLYELARALLLKSPDPIPRIVNPDPVSYTQGRQDTFWLTDLEALRPYTIQATLRLVTPHAYWYVEDGSNASQSDLERAAGVFEAEIYPRVSAAFGTEWTPGIDNDPHLTVLHARLRGAAGYFSSVDEYPSSVHPHSNQREIIYIDGNASGRIGSRQYLAVLSHELQHAIHWNGDSSEETWITEGLSEVAAAVAGYRPTNQNAFLISPTVSMINWPDHIASYYGAAFLFLDYLATHYGTRADLALLVKEPADGIQGIDAYLAGLGYNATFRDVFKDWTVAVLLDEPGGPYGYPDKDVRVRVTARMDKSGQRESSIPQYSAEYTAINVLRGDIRVRFQGQRENTLLPTSLDGGNCWWSNRGDSISSTLTQELDLSGLDTATLRFRTWFDVEEDWDYAYVEVSTDGGSTWDILPAAGTSTRNPLANSFGPGYTGRSDGWLEAEVDLTAHARQTVLLRFHYVTDDAINNIGLCVDDISVPEIALLGGGLSEDGWQAEGFLRTDNRVPQDYIVQIIEVGDETRVREMALDGNNFGEMTIRDLEGLDEVTVVVAALAPKTDQEASYTLTIEPTT